MKFEPQNYLLKTSHHAKFHFDLTTWVVSANTQHDWKDLFQIHVSSSSAETLVRTGGITNHHLIAYSVSDISGKTYQNQMMCVEVMVCSIIVVFWDTVCSHFLQYVLWRCWLGCRKGIWPVKTEWWGTGMVICLEQVANHLRMVQLMPVPPHHLLLQ